MIWKVSKSAIKIGKPYLVTVVSDPQNIDWDTADIAIGRFDGENWEIANQSDRCIVEDSHIIGYANIPNSITNPLHTYNPYDTYLVFVKWGNMKNHKRMIGTYYKSVWSLGDLHDAFEMYPDDIASIRTRIIIPMTEREYKTRKSS